MNPPYGSEIKNWVKKAHDEASKGATVVGLIPSRTDTKYWHKYIIGKAEVRFVQSRIKFEGCKTKSGKLEPAPFGSAVVVFRKNKKPVNKLYKMIF